MCNKGRIKCFFTGAVLMILMVTLTPFSSDFVKDAAAQTPAKVTKWKLQTGFSASPQGRIYMPHFADLVRQRTGGRLDIEIIPEGTVVKAQQGFDAVSKGVLDAQNYYCAPWIGKMPVAHIEFGLPFGWRNGDECFDIMYNEGLIDLLRREYAKHNIYLLASFPTDALYFGTNFPISKYSDVKGHNVTGLGLCGNWFKKLGANQVEVPYLEMYMALQQGVIEGTIAAVTALVSYKHMEVLKYLWLPHPLNPDVCQIIVNMDKWKALPPDIQEVLRGPIARDISKYIDKSFVEDDIKSIEATTKHGVKIQTMPDSEVKKARAIAQPIWTETSQDPAYTQALKIVTDYLKRKKVIE